MIGRTLRRWADADARKRIADLETKLDTANRKLEVAQAEIDTQAAVIARDRKRIEAETACYARKQADAEGNADERIDEGIRRFSA